jgi:CHAD domain-containing protein
MTATISQRAPRASLFFARTLTALDKALGETLPRVLASADEEALHDFRVEVRKLRTLLKAARPLYGRFHADAVRAGFTEMHRATGALRDEEVFLELLGTLGLDGDEMQSFVQKRHARERALRRKVLALVRSPKVKRTRALLDAIVILPLDPAREKDLHRFARKTVERALARVEALRHTPTTDNVGLHDLRIAYKELRYACELMATALPPDVSALAEPAAKMQKRLGEIHDVDAGLVSISRSRSLSPLLRARLTQALHLRREKLVAKYIELAAAQAQAAAQLEGDLQQDGKTEG